VLKLFAALLSMLKRFA